MTESVAAIKYTGAHAKIEEFLTISKGQSGKAIELLIEQVLSNPVLYFFGELLA